MRKHDVSPIRVILALVIVLLACDLFVPPLLALFGFSFIDFKPEYLRPFFWGFSQQQIRFIVECGLLIGAVWMLRRQA